MGTKILEKIPLTPVTSLYRLDAPMIAASAKPGQFVILRVRENGERIPITITDFDRDSGVLTIVVQEVGVTTKCLGQLQAGDEIMDVVGPLGMPADIPSGGHIVGVGGGFGAAALICIMRELKARGEKTTVVIGARNQDLLIMIDELKSICDNVELCTDDGSAGFKGFVTERLQQMIDGEVLEPPDCVIAIGPMPMMRAVSKTTEASKILTLVSLDPLMVDGTGMCGGCRVTVNEEVKFACVDGPFFDAHQVDFEEAVRRNKMYVEEEQQKTACRTSEIGAA